MTESPFAQAACLIEQACALIDTSPESLPALLVIAGGTRRLEQAMVSKIAAVERDRDLVARGYKSDTAGLRDLLGWDHATARRHVNVARHVAPRTSEDGTVSEPVLPATAAAFTAGVASMRHVEVIAGLMNSPAGKRLDAADRVSIEEALGEAAWTTAPHKIHALGRELIAAADVDGPDDQPGRNEFTMRTNPDGSGTIHGTFDDPEALAVIRTVLDGRTRPTAENRGTTAGERNAAALVEICRFALGYANTGNVKGERPHLVVTIKLEDLENRARGAMLDTGGQLTPSQLRRIACDARLIPVVLGKGGEVLDVGRASREIPLRTRRAVAARDGGCAHPNCDRPPSWCECHHVIEWQHGGPTDVDNLVMLCCEHHDQIHSTEWTIDMSTGTPKVIPPPWLTELWAGQS